MLPHRRSGAAQRGHRRRLPRPAIPSLFHQDQGDRRLGPAGRDHIDQPPRSRGARPNHTRIRPRHVAPRGDHQPDADFEMLPRHRLPAVAHRGALPQTIVVRIPALVPGRERPEGKHAPVHRLPAGKGVPLLGSGPLLQPARLDFEFRRPGRRDARRGHTPTVAHGRLRPMRVPLRQRRGGPPDRIHGNGKRRHDLLLDGCLHPRRPARDTHTADSRRNRR